MIAHANPPLEDEGSASFDLQVYSAARTALGMSKYTPIRQLTCRVFGGVVELSGTVPSFYMKQLAQTAILHLGCGHSVRNLVEVHGEPASLVAIDCAAQPAKRSA